MTAEDTLAFRNIHFIQADGYPIEINYAVQSLFYFKVEIDIDGHDIDSCTKIYTISDHIQFI